MDAGPNVFNARSRFIAHTLFEPVDHPPYFETIGFWPQVLDRWYDEGLPRHVRHRYEQSTLADGEVTLEQYFQIDTYSWPPFGPAGVATPFWPVREKTVLEEDDDTVVYRDASGIVCRDVKRGRSMPQFLKFPVESPDDWELLKPSLDPNIEERYADAHRQADEFNQRDYLVPLAICGAYGLPRNLMGEENLSYAYYDYPDMLHDILRQWLTFYVEYARRLCDIVQFDYVFLWEDLAFKTGPLIGPALAEQFIFPYYRELIAELRKLGFRVFSLDSDGNPKVLMDGFIDAGVNHFHPCEIAADMRPQWIRQRYGRRCAIQGGIDKRVLTKGRDAIKAEVMDTVPELLRGGGYAPGIDHSVPSDVPLESFVYFLELVRQLGRDIPPEPDLASRVTVSG